MNTKTIQSTKNRIELWLKVLNEVKPSRVAEIGVWKGDFAATLLRQCHCIQEYMMIDPWARLPDWNKPCNVSDEVFDDVYREAMEKTRFAADKVKVLRGRTKSVIGDIEDESIDFVYVDGDHTLRGITIDLINVLPKVRQGGYIAGDDFTKSPWQHSVDFEPTMVCPFAVYFAEAMDLPIRALPHSQFVITKCAETGFSFRDETGEYGALTLKDMLQKS